MLWVAIVLCAEPLSLTHPLPLSLSLPLLLTHTLSSPSLSLSVCVSVYPSLCLSVWIKLWIRYIKACQLFQQSDGANNARGVAWHHPHHQSTKNLLFLGSKPLV